IGPADAARARGDDVSESITLRDANEPNKAGEHTRLLISPVDMPGGTGVLVLGTPLESADTAINRVTRAAVTGGIPAVVLAGLAAWVLASAALRPVERLRRQVAEFSAHDASTSIAVPPTRDEIAALAGTMNELLGRLRDA